MTSHGEPMTFRTSGWSYFSVGYDPTGEEVIASVFLGTGPSEVRQWSTHTTKPIGEPFVLPSAMQGPATVVYSRDGSVPATGMRDGSVLFWDATTRQPVLRPLHVGSQVAGLAFNPRGDLLAVNSWSDTMQIYTFPALEPYGAPMQHQAIVWASVFSPDGRWIATKGFDGSSGLWDVHTGRNLGAFIKQEPGIHDAAFDPSGKRLLTGTLDPGPSSIFMWDLPDQPGTQREMEIRTWLALGKRATESGGQERLDWSEWDALNRELREVTSGASD